jgi:hypothetical protein
MTKINIIGVRLRASSQREAIAAKRVIIKRVFEKTLSIYHYLPEKIIHGSKGVILPLQEYNSFRAWRFFKGH